MNKKTISLLLALVMLLSLLSACSGSQASATTANATTAAPAAAATTAETATDFAGQELSILVSQGWMDNFYDGIIARFEDQYSVTVDLQTVPADQYDDLLQSKLTTGTATDIFWIQSNPFAIKSVLVDPAAYCMDFTGAAWQAIIPEERQSACMADGKLYGMMLWTNSPEYVMLYNKTLFDEMGLAQVPGTYAELLAACDTLAAEGITPWFVPGADGWQHQLAFFQIGGVYEQAQKGLYDGLNNNTATFADNAKMQEVLGQMKELSDKGYFGDDWIGTDSTNMANLFGDRSIAMAMANPGYINQIKEETGSTDEFGLFLIPLGDNQNYPTNPAGPIMLANKNSQNPELVKAFFDFCVTDESLQELLDAHTGWTNLAVNEEVAKINQHWLDAEKALIENVPSERRQAPVLQTGTKFTNDYWMDFGADMVAYFTGQIEANDVLKNMDANRAESATLQEDPAWK
ncbi:MAG: ABC transporter substrate-binding protein [Eubacteriales bacterium]|nr:ABC transporter substrate-binding protein [Eubacteriales bacterium]